MEQLTQEFLMKNKEALLQEMGGHIENLTDLLSAAIGGEIAETAEQDAALLRNILIAMSQSIGVIATCFNQYYVFETGEIQQDQERPIGFRALHDQVKKNKDA